jgi:putative peptidoglycan lipid II flippase
VNAADVPPTQPTGFIGSGLALLYRFVPRGAIVLSALTFAAYVMGLVRDRIVLQEFGATAEVDAYKAAFIVPELSLGVIVASGLAAPFIPIYTRLLRDGQAAAQGFGQTIMTLAVLAMAVVCGFLFIVAPQTVEIVAPGFGPAQRELYTDLFRVMVITPVIFAGSIALGEILIAERRFIWYGLAPIAYNLGIIVGTVLLAERLGIFAAAVGAVLGALFHLGIRALGISRTSFRIRPRLAVRTAAIREFIVLMLPKTVSSPIEPLTFLYFTRVASTLVAGSVTAVDVARNFQSVPVSLIGVAFSLAAFPAFSAAYAAADRRGFVGLVVRNGLTIGALTFGAAIVIFVVGELAISVLLGGGRFDDEAVERTALVLAAFAMSVPLESLSHLLSRAIYATHHTLLQVGASLAGFAVTIVATQVLVEDLGIIAIPIGFTAGGAVKVVLLVVVLGDRIRRMQPADAVSD